MIDSISAATSGASSASQTGASKSRADGDYETFLKMLTAQIKNQDPLNPMENSEFAVQLATFSGVEQQAKTNQLLEQFIGSNTQINMGQVSHWIGKEARVTGPVYYSGDPLTLQIDADRSADDVVLITRDSYGREIARLSIGPGRGEVDWSGVTPDGKRMMDGLYSFSIESMKDGKVISQKDVGVFTKVLQAETTPDGVMLGLAGGAVAALDNVSAIRAPQS